MGAEEDAEEAERQVRMLDWMTEVRNPTEIRRKIYPRMPLRLRSLRRAILHLPRKSPLLLCRKHLPNPRILNLARERPLKQSLRAK